MKYYKGLLYGELYNLGFMGPGRCGVETCKIDGHYAYVTDLKKFVLFKFGDYAGFTSIRKEYQEPDLTPMEVLFVNDALIDSLTRDMSNTINPNCTNIEDTMWDDIYGDTRLLMQDKWSTLKKHPFSLSNVSPNIQQMDVVTDGVRTFVASYGYDHLAMNKNPKYVLVERSNYFPAIPLMGQKQIEGTYKTKVTC